MKNAVGKSAASPGTAEELSDVDMSDAQSTGLYSVNPP